MNLRHANRVAFVTGAAGGIGRGVARRLASEGALVACVDINQERAEETVRLLEDGGPRRGLALAADVRSRAQVVAARDAALAAFGRIDYLVNNAGVITMSGFDELTDAEWELVLDVNLKGYFIVSQVVSQAIAGNGGAIVNISTVESEVVVSS